MTKSEWRGGHDENISDVAFAAIALITTELKRTAVATDATAAHCVMRISWSSWLSIAPRTCGYPTS